MTAERVIMFLIGCSIAFALLFAAIDYGENNRGSAATNLMIAGLLYAAGRITAG